MSTLNGSWEDIKGLRSRAAGLGIEVGEKSRYELINAIDQKNKQTEVLRRRCAKRGLDTSGTENELRLRLANYENTGVKLSDRKLYSVSAFFCALLGVAALGISIPHIAGAFVAIMGISLGYALLLAVIIDGGICTLKVIESLSSKFALPAYVRGTAGGLLVACLVFSATLNASQFVRHTDTVWEIALAVLTACFLSVFVYCMFLVASSMVLKCEERRQEEDDPAAIFRKAADEYERLKRMARSES